MENYKFLFLLSVQFRYSMQFFKEKTKYAQKFKKHFRPPKIPRLFVIILYAHMYDTNIITESHKLSCDVI